MDRRHTRRATSPGTTRTSSEARVTGRPRLVVVRESGRVELPDTVAYLLMTLSLTAVVLLPVVLGRYS